jgi:hypothetical protein
MVTLNLSPSPVSHGAYVCLAGAAIIAVSFHFWQSYFIALMRY